MQYDILVTKTAGNGYIARPILWPELTASGDSENEALARVGEAIQDFATNSRIVQLELPDVAATITNPWRQFAAIWADVPEAEWQQYLAELDAIRAAANQTDDFADDVHS